MKRKNYLIIVLLSTLIAAPSAFAESKRVEVYSLSQNYWDTQPGETLGEIAAQLLPNNFNLQQKLMNDIVSLNPDAFQDGDPNYMLANTRLWLPNNLPKTDDKIDSKHTQVESFSWGNINRPIR
ncbi:FimV family protein [Pseudomonadota bacterium]